MVKPQQEAGSVNYVEMKWLASDLLGSGMASHFSRTAANA